MSEFTRSIQVSDYFERLLSWMPRRSMFRGIYSTGKTKAWSVLEGDSGGLIAAFVDAKGACSCRFCRFENGGFIRKSRADGPFRTAFAALI
jgi:hypothetical protein